MTLISAPAGFGKTTLAADWLGDSQQKVAWITLDESDNDPILFLKYLIEALAQIEAGFGKTTLGLLASTQPPQELILATLVNEIAAIPKPFYLVVDDYHCIHTPQIHQQLAFLMQHQPPQMHLVLITREDPLLPLSRLRASGQMNEIRQEDLRFTQVECAQLFQDMLGFSLADNEIELLEQRTEGWIAGLQLAILSMPNRSTAGDFIKSFSGSSRYILDYLMDEVFKSQPAAVQDFLIKTSVLDQLSGPLCDAVVMRTDSQAMLEMLEQANLFIVPLDQNRDWYRYHRLFGGLLRHRLEHTSNLSAADLHSSASRWYAANGLPSQAIRHSISAADWNTTAALLKQHTGQLLKLGEVVTLVAWYSQIPEPFIQADALLSLDYSWPLLLTGQFGAAGSILDRLESAAQEAPEFLGQIASAQAYLARALGAHQRMVEKSQQALALLPKNDLASRCLVSVNLGLAYWHMGRMQDAEIALKETIETGKATGNHYAVVTAMIMQGRVHAVRGQLRQAADLFNDAARHGSGFPINTLAHLDLSYLHYEWNQLEEASRQLGQAIELSIQHRSDEFLIACWLMESRLAIATGDWERNRQALDKAQARIQVGDIPFATTQRVFAAQVESALEKNDLAAASALADELRDNVNTHSFYRFLGLTRARLLWAQGQRDAANALLDTLYNTAVEAGWIYGVIAVRVVQAATAHQAEAALNYLIEALTLAQPENYIRTFADAGRSLAPLLQKAARQGIFPDTVRQILAAIGAKREIIDSPPVESLSERELEVLRLVTAGLSNREIAKDLFISIGTVKTHIHNICGKLGARNRTDAVVQAKELGLV